MASVLDGRGPRQRPARGAGDRASTTDSSNQRACASRARASSSCRQSPRGRRSQKAVLDASTARGACEAIASVTSSRLAARLPAPREAALEESPEPPQVGTRTASRSIRAPDAAPAVSARSSPWRARDRACRREPPAASHRLVRHGHVRGDLQRPRDRGVDLAQEVDQPAVGVRDLLDNRLRTAPSSPAAACRRLAALVDEKEVAQGCIRGPGNSRSDLAHHLREPRGVERLEQPLRGADGAIRVVAADAAAEVGPGKCSTQVVRSSRSCVIRLFTRYAHRSAAVPASSRRGSWSGRRAEDRALRGKSSTRPAMPKCADGLQRGDAGLTPPARRRAARSRAPDVRGRALQRRP